MMKLQNNYPRATAESTESAEALEELKIVEEIDFDSGEGAEVAPELTTAELSEHFTAQEAGLDQQIAQELGLGDKVREVAGKVKGWLRGAALTTALAMPAVGAANTNESPAEVDIDHAPYAGEAFEVARGDWGNAAKFFEQQSAVLDIQIAEQKLSLSEVAGNVVDNISNELKENPNTQRLYLKNIGDRDDLKKAWKAMRGKAELHDGEGKKALGYVAKELVEYELKSVVKDVLNEAHEKVSEHDDMNPSVDMKKLDDLYCDVYKEHGLSGSEIRALERAEEQAEKMAAESRDPKLRFAINVLRTAFGYEIANSGVYAAFDGKKVSMHHNRWSVNAAEDGAQFGYSGKKDRLGDLEDVKYGMVAGHNEDDGGYIKIAFKGSF